MGAAEQLEVEEPEKRWAPQPGPQMAFAGCPADIAIFGGSAGGGKSYALLYEAVKWVMVEAVRRYRAVIFRRKTNELTGGGGLWDESQEMYRAFGGVPRAAPTLDWTFEPANGNSADRHRVEFRHMQHVKDVHSHQGRQYAFIGFDELTHFTEYQFWYMVSRLRSVSGVRPYLRATCNPDPDSFVAKLIEWWIGEDGYAIPERSGVIRWMVRRDDKLEWYDREEEAWATVRWLVNHEGTVRVFDDKASAQRFARAAANDNGDAPRVDPDAVPMSFTFIASRLADNPLLLKHDPGYRAKLLSLPRVERERLLGDEARGGNWKIRAAAGMVFPRSDFRLADNPPSRVLATVRFWDKASSEPTAKHPNPDWSRGVRVSLCEGNLLWIDDLVSLQARSTKVLLEMRRTAKADTIGVTVGIWQDTGGAGLVDVDTTMAALGGWIVEVVESFAADTSGLTDGTHKSSRAKRAFANAWAPWVQKGWVYVKRDQPWTEELLTEADNFPDARFDDIIDAISGAFQLLVGTGGGFWDQMAAAADQIGSGRF